MSLQSVNVQLLSLHPKWDICFFFPIKRVGYTSS